MSPSRAVAPLILALAVLGACSSTTPATAPPTQQPAPAPAGPATPTAGLCEQLDAGAAPLQALGAQPGAEADPEGTVREAVAAIRADCPQHTAAADGLQSLLDQQPSTQQDDDQDDGAQDDGERDDVQDDEQDPGEAALQACVEQTEQTEAQCREQAASGGAS